jgi:hypothetical protein
VKAGQIKRGDYYEDCASQPVVCTEADYREDLISGISPERDVGLLQYREVRRPQALAG